MLYELSYSQFWKDAKNLCQDMFEDTNFTDVTLVCGEDKRFNAHKVILSSCSTLFRNILINNPHPKPLIYFHDIKEEQMEILVKFIYTGEVSVVQEDLDALLEVAEKLQIKGLASSNEKKEHDSDKEKEVKDNLFNQVVNDAIEDYPKSDGTIEKEEESRCEEELLEESIEAENNSKRNDNTLDDEQVEIFPETNVVKMEPLTEIEEKIVKKEDGRSILKKFPCKFCNHRFTLSSNLTTHMKSLHGYVKEKIPRMDAKFPCDECDYRATQAGNLKSHKQMKHEGLRFPCNFCSHESSSTSNLKTHVKTRHTDK